MLAPSGEMASAIETFARLLRKSGLRSSPAELVDALSALDVVGFEQPDQVRAALAATLCKREADLEIFDELFELYFLGGGSVLKLGSGDSIAEAARSAGAESEFVDFLVDRLRDAAPELSSMARALLGIQELDLGQLIRRGAADIDLSRIKSPLQVGFYSHQLSRQLGLPQAAGEADGFFASVGREGMASENAYAAMAETVRGNMNRLRDGIRDFVRSEFERQNADFSRRFVRESLAEKALVSLSPREIERMRDEVRRLAALFKERLRRKRGQRRRGRLDVGRTLRRSMTTDGVPFAPAFDERRPSKARVAILCDLSDSVRSVSRFMLQFAYTLADCFDRVESFGFVSDVGELSSLFRELDIDRAIDAALDGKAVNVFSNSNYGHALQEFQRRYMGRITRKTTLIVIGDGRNNYHPPRDEILEEIRSRARRVIWVCPEGRPSWSFGDSVMQLYAEHCDSVVVAHNLLSLRQVIDELVEDHS